MEKECILLEKQQLANNLSVFLYDLSRKVAADRWLIKIKCVASIRLPEDFFEEKLKESDDPDLVYDIKEKFGGNLSCELVRELNFVDEDDKDGSIIFLMDSLKENSIDYMGRESFLRKLLAKKYNEYKQEIQTRTKLGLKEEDEEDEDEGPADFSTCFQD